MAKGNWWKTFGPGLVFAGTAIGVSHLIQSTRAGASYGYALIWAVVLANFFKYPFFEFGSRFAQATGTSLLVGYSKIGKWSLWMYFIITLASMFTVTGAVSFVTTALLANLLNLQTDSSFYLIAASLYAFCIGVLLIGNYKALDRFIKVVAVFLAVSTFAAFFMVLFNNPEVLSDRQPHLIWEGKEHLIFAIALMGWMPTAVDLSAWNSIWTLERIKESGYKPTLKQTLLDFRIGYLFSAVLALVFLYLGAELMFYPGKEFPNSSAGFVQSLIGLFTGALGQWSYFIIAISAFSVMLSTTISVFDGYARAMSQTVELLGLKFKRGNVFWLILTGVGGFLVITIFKNQLKTLVDVATIVSFVIAPIVAMLNYKLLFSKFTPAEAQPSKWLKVWSIAGLVFLSGFLVVFIFVSIS